MSTQPQQQAATTSWQAGDLVTTPAGWPAVVAEVEKEWVRVDYPQSRGAQGAWVRRGQLVAR